MAEGAVFQLLSSFAPYLQEHLNLLTGVREEIQYIKDEFERMSSFLRHADELEEKNPNLKVWVKQVREAAYDTADALDMYMLRLGHHHGPGFRGFLRKVSCFIKTFKARYQIASEAKRIKYRVINISEGHQRYSGIYGTVDHQQPRYDCRGDALLLQDADLVGIDYRKSQLTRWLVDEEDPRLKVLSIAGMGGLGKTTLTKKIYDDPTVKMHFQNHAWITISASPKVDQLLKDMIRQLFEEVKQPLPERVDHMDTHRLKLTIKDFLQQKRFLLVLDDVWTTIAWEAFEIAFPECNSGSRILLTTRDAVVASSASQKNHGRVYDLEPLSTEESWDLFCNKTFQGNPCPLHLEALSSHILVRCGGLPLAIVAISGLLSTKKNSVDEWERICRSLGAELEGNNGKLRRINKILSLSYFDLHSYLKLCFLYLSIFPEDFLFDHWRLIRLWVAEKFVEVKEGMTKEEVADDYLNELVNRSLVQVVKVRKDGRSRAYRIHDLLREIIITKSREQNIVTIESERGRALHEKVRRLSIYQDLKDIQQSDCFTRLRSLLVFSATDSLSILSKLASVGDHLRLLTVLDLGGTQLETFPNEIVKLIHLTYLSLRGTEVKMIPKSIEKLKKLETLDLKQTGVTELPDNIVKLQHLRHLLLYRYNPGHAYKPFHSQSGFKAPEGIGSLSSLQKLCAIEANHGSNGDTVLREVGKLTQLRRLKILMLRKEDERVLCSSLEKLNKLRSLTVYTAEEDEIIDLDSLSLPPRLLQRLCLVGRLQKLPRWILALHNLKEVRLSWSKLKNVDDPLQSLQYLPNLVVLHLYLAYEGDRLCFKAGEFQKLQTLVLLGLEGLRWMRVEAGSMPLLENLYIGKCKLMTELPSGVEHLSNLKHVALMDMSDSFISRLDKKHLQGGGEDKKHLQGGGEDYWKVEHIPDVLIGDTSTGGSRGYFL